MIGQGREIAAGVKNQEEPCCFSTAKFMEARTWRKSSQGISPGGVEFRAGLQNRDEKTLQAPL